MKIKLNLPLLSLLVLGGIISLLAHAMPSDFDSDEISPSNSAAPTEARSDAACSATAATVASAGSARSTGAAFEDDDAINSAATDGGDQTDAIPIDNSEAGLAQKTQEATTATTTWNQEQKQQYV